MSIGANTQQQKITPYFPVLRPVRWDDNGTMKNPSSRCCMGEFFGNETTN